MPVLENLKKVAEKVTGIARPQRRDLNAVIRNRKPNVFRFKDDGVIPNNAKLPLVVYRTPVRFPSEFDPAAIFEELFELNGWSGSWRDGVYDYLHYHSRTHEVLGIARGNAVVQFGGQRGRRLTLKAGDVAVLAAGIGHRRIECSSDLLVVGAYPTSGKYDERTASEKDHDEALRSISKVALPKKDPVYGRQGPLIRLWS